MRDSVVRNLRSFLMSSSLSRAMTADYSTHLDLTSFVCQKFPTLPRQNNKCSNITCLACPLLAQYSQIRSTHTHRLFSIDTSLTCQTNNIIYVLQCRTRGKQYVDTAKKCLRIETSKLKLSIKTATDPIVRHLIQVHQTYSLQVKVCILCKGSTIDSKEHWMSKLSTKVPNGLNSLTESLIGLIRLFCH